ncbi:hypothetical protein K491DRAFT_752775 [Lophiostoma macrostomum CBS 122681]|uniref:Uncharacterized protein n=1 Tax=Lophiostoma macrostomum CBS 122681 TaxID=1314788 RepID=A0A6A6TS04_9PLEO|nr:hypothetical protein K491DRAFT_752775 [Lophiostoma macrostomum CBS 122681]
MEPRDSTVGMNTRISKPKGKGKEPVRFASKLSASASGLLQDALGNLGANDLQDALSSSGKLEPSSSPNSPPYWLQELPLLSTGTTAHRQSSALRSTFRSSRGPQDRNYEFEEFVEYSGSSTPDLDLNRTDPAAWLDHHTHSLGAKSRVVFAEESFADSVLDWTDLKTAASQYGLSSLSDQETATSPSLGRPPACMSDPKIVSSPVELDKMLSINVQRTADLEDLSHSQSRLLHQQDRDNFLSESIHANGHALIRVRMIIDHLADSAQLLSPQQDLGFQQVVLNNPQQNQYSALCGSAEMNLNKMGSQPMSEAVVLHASDQSDTNEPKAGGNSMEEQAKPSFHCPWVRCHQRFNNVETLSTHAQYSCIHDDCVVQFSSHQDWAEHIARPHHDLQEGNFPMTLVSSGGTICAVAATANGKHNH